MSVRPPSVAQGSIVEDSRYLIAVTDLFHDLNNRRIKYCHWKSNANLNRSLKGLTDLDILVDREHAQHFRVVLHQHNVKPIVSPSSRRYPAVEDYLGFDRDTGRQFHLHVHYQLVLGEQFVKNYRLPIERHLLDNTQRCAGIVNVPSPNLEIIVLAIRALLKYRDRDVIKDMLCIRSAGLPASIQNEFRYLFEKTDLESISKTLGAELSLVPSSVILEFLSTVTNTPRAGFVFYRLRRQLRRELSAYQRHGRWRAKCEYFWVILRRRLSFLRTYSSRKMPIAGGMTIGVIGADGAGKSTVVNELCQWLSWKMNVHRYYLGSQEPSLLSKGAHLIFRIAGSGYWRWGRLVGQQRASTKVLDGLQRLLHNMYHISTAWDRYRRYSVGRRQALQGALVIYDRYPLQGVHRVMPERPMDGPRIAAEPGAKMDSLTSTISRIERDIYRRILPPDHLFILHVSPHISRQRKLDHDHSVIEDKCQALRQMDKQGLRVTEIDADRPLEQVLLQIKTTLWDLL